MLPKLTRPPTSRPQISGGTVMLGKCLLQVVMYTHWFACLWALQTQLGETLAS
jgi:hypothetical protein